MGHSVFKLGLMGRQPSIKQAEPLSPVCLDIRAVKSSFHDWKDIWKKKFMLEETNIW